MSHTVQGPPVSEYVPLSKALRQYGNPSPASIWRWTRKGVRGVKLQAWLIGGRWHTTLAAAAEFVAATTATANTTGDADDTGAGESTPQLGKGPKVTSKQSLAQAERECAASGI